MTRQSTVMYGMRVWHTLTVEQDAMAIDNYCCLGTRQVVSSRWVQTDLGCKASH